MRKINFQKIRYKTCSYRWNEELNQLELNPDHYNTYPEPLPEIFNE